MEYIAILAGNFQQYQEFVTRGLNHMPEVRERCIYIGHPKDIMGKKIVEKLIIGTFYNYPKWGDLEEMVDRTIMVYNPDFFKKELVKIKAWAFFAEHRGRPYFIKNDDKSAPEEIFLKKPKPRSHPLALSKGDTSWKPTKILITIVN